MLNFTEPEGFIDSADNPPLPDGVLLHCTYTVTVYTGYGVELQVRTCTRCITLRGGGGVEEGCRCLGGGADVEGDAGEAHIVGSLQDAVAFTAYGLSAHPLDRMGGVKLILLSLRRPARLQVELWLNSAPQWSLVELLFFSRDRPTF